MKILYKQFKPFLDDEKLATGHQSLSQMYKCIGNMFACLAIHKYLSIQNRYNIIQYKATILFYYDFNAYFCLAAFLYEKISNIEMLDKVIS